MPLTQSAIAILTRLERSPDGPVFPISFEALSSAWRRIVTRTRVENFRFHDLRHEATIRLTERGLGVMDVQHVTGHKTLAMLLRYMQLNVAGVVQRLDATDPSPPTPNVLRFPSRR